MNLEFDFDNVLPPELKQRIYDARRSGKLSDCENAVLELLVDYPSGPRAGREKALRISSMQGRWTRNGSHVWSDRVVKDAVKQLLEIHEVPIGSSRSAGCSGYFLMISEEDLQASERPLRGELLSIAKRLRALNPKSQFARTLVGQLSMERDA